MRSPSAQRRRTASSRATDCSARSTQSLAEGHNAGATEPASASLCGVHYHDCLYWHFAERLQSFSSYDFWRITSFMIPAMVSGFTKAVLMTRW
jgi:hypothetical protein